MLSTPPAMNSSPWPQLAARAVSSTAARPLPHRRLTVRPPVSIARPASSAAWRATLRASSPAWLVQPTTASSKSWRLEGIAGDQRLDHAGEQIVRAGPAPARRHGGRSACASRHRQSVEHGLLPCARQACISASDRQIGNGSALDRQFAGDSEFRKGQSMRDFQLAAPFGGDGRRSHGGDLASAGDAGRGRDSAPGGNAVDAAIAAVAVLVRRRAADDRDRRRLLRALFAQGRPPIALNGSGPRADEGDGRVVCRARHPRRSPAESPHAVTVPGAVDAWFTAARRSRHEGRGGAACSRRSALAEEGCVVDAARRPRFAGCRASWRDDPAARAHFMPRGQGARGAASACASRRWPRRCARIARDGREAFYEGAVAAEIVARLNARRRPAHARGFRGAALRVCRRRSPRHYRGCDGLRMPAQRPGHRRADDPAHARRL